MSNDAYAGAVIGVRFVLPRAAKVVRPSCDHPGRVGNVFCPICGKRVGDLTVEDASPDVILDGIEDRLPTGYVFERSNEFSRDNFLGYGCTAGGGGRSEGAMVSLPDVAEVRRTVMALLEGTGIFSEEAFGMHVYLAWS